MQSGRGCNDRNVGPTLSLVRIEMMTDLRVADPEGRFLTATGAERMRLQGIDRASTVTA